MLLAGQGSREAAHEGGFWGHGETGARGWEKTACPSVYCYHHGDLTCMSCCVSCPQPCTRRNNWWIWSLACFHIASATLNQPSFGFTLLALKWLYVLWSLFLTLFLPVSGGKVSQNDYSTLSAETSICSCSCRSADKYATTDSNVPPVFEKDSLLIPVSN